MVNAGVCVSDQYTDILNEDKKPPESTRLFLVQSRTEKAF